MPAPLSPSVAGPIVTTSPVIRVHGALKDAEVVLYIDNKESPLKATATSNGDVVIPVTIALQERSLITAIQANADGKSGPSNEAIPVLAVPDELTPHVLSPVHSCMWDVQVGNLVPGATVRATIWGDQYANLVAQESNQWLELDRNLPIIAGRRMTISQEINVNGQIRFGSIDTPAIPLFDNEGLLPAPEFDELVACQQGFTVTRAVSGAISSIQNGNWSASFANPRESFPVDSCPPLVEGDFTASQSLPRCGIEGAKGVYQVKHSDLSITFPLDLCPDAKKLPMSGLSIGGQLHLGRRVGQGSTTWYGARGISLESDDIDIPRDFAFTDPAGAVALMVYQEQPDCKEKSPEYAVEVSALNPNETFSLRVPDTQRPYSCTKGVRVTGAHVGASQQVFDAETQQPIGPQCHLTASTGVVTTWFRLRHSVNDINQKLFVRQNGCHLDGDAGTEVQDAPQPPPTVKLPDTVLNGSTEIPVRDIIPGATVQLQIKLSNKPGFTSILTPEIEVWDDHAMIPVGNAVPFGYVQVGNTMWGMQTLCGTSSMEGVPGTQVVIEPLSANADPDIVVRGKVVDMIVHVHDSHGNPVAAGVIIDSAQYGWGNQKFQFGTELHQKEPVCYVALPIGYSNAGFQIHLIDPPAPPPPPPQETTWTLQFRAAPDRLQVDQVFIDILKTVFTVTPDWTNVPQTVTVDRSNHDGQFMSASLQLTLPPSGKASVKVHGHFHYSNTAGVVAGLVTITAQAGKDTDEFPAAPVQGPLPYWVVEYPKNHAVQVTLQAQADTQNNRIAFDLDTLLSPGPV